MRMPSRNPTCGAAPRNLTTNITPAILADALDAQAKVLASMADALRSGAVERGESKYLDQATSPLSRRVFLHHARSGSFPTKRIGKRVLVERDVFERWLAKQQTERRRRVPSAPVSGPRSIDNDVLAELGARRSGGR